jgi:hypothetical protein
MVHAASGEDIDSPFALFFGDIEDDNFDYVEAVFNFYAGLSGHDWVSTLPGESRMDQSALTEYDVSSSTLEEVLGVTSNEARRIFEGDRIPTKDQVEVVAKLTNLNPDDFLSPIHVPEVDALSSPSLKCKVLELAALMKIGEGEARNAILQDDFGLAARHTSKEENKAKDRVIDSINRMLAAAESVDPIRLPDMPSNQSLLLRPKFYIPIAEVLTEEIRRDGFDLKQLSDDPFREIPRSSEIVIKMQENLPESCHVDARYDGRSTPPVMYVRDSGNEGRDSFSILHELAHHAQENSEAWTDFYYKIDQDLRSTVEKELLIASLPDFSLAMNSSPHTLEAMSRPLESGTSIGTRRLHRSPVW